MISSLYYTTKWKQPRVRGLFFFIPLVELGSPAQGIAADGSSDQSFYDCFIYMTYNIASQFTSLLHNRF